MKSVVFVIITMGKSVYLEDMLITLQKYQNVVVVDNSKNGICEGMVCKYNVRYLHETESGVSSARNAGATLAESEDYIYFLDDDLSFGSEWSSELNKILNDDITYDLVGGRVIAEYPSDIVLPEKYLYLVGKKDFGLKDIIIKNDYVGGCNFLVSRERFVQIGGFERHFGHKENLIGLNEDVLFQEKIRQVGGNVYYKPKLSFVHHWNGNIEDIYTRLQLQGIYDRKVDLKVNRTRFCLRIIKYSAWMGLFKIIDLIGKDSEVLKCDYLRYKAYLRDAL